MCWVTPNFWENALTAEKKVYQPGVEVADGVGATLRTFWGGADDAGAGLLEILALSAADSKDPMNFLGPLDNEVTSNISAVFMKESRSDASTVTSPLVKSKKKKLSFFK